MRSLFLIMVIQLGSCFHKQSNYNIVERMFSKHKVDWKINGIDYKWKDFDYYGQPLYDCVVKIDAKSLKVTNSYMIRFANDKDIIVEIMEFKELAVAHTVYENATKYAEKIRTTVRKNASQLCQPIKEWDFHYVLNDNRKIYLVGCVSGNISFKNGDASLESDEANLYEAKMVFEYIKKNIRG